MLRADAKGQTMLDENCPIEEVRAMFAQDRFATEMCGCRVLEAERGHSVCAFNIADTHLNAQGNVMGGALFTLADFALAIACNIGEEPTMSVASSIEYFSLAKGTQLIATCDVEKSGRSIGFYTVRIEDDLGTAVALMTATCYRSAAKKH